MTSCNNNNSSPGVGFFKSIFGRKKEQPLPRTIVPGEKMPHEFIWKYGGKEISLYGDWDDWQAGIKLQPRLEGEGHSTTVLLDASKPWTFKYVVDGEWRCTLDLPTVQDEKGNVNNILHPLPHHRNHEN